MIKEDLLFLANIATGAGDIIMNHFNCGTDVERKNDGSPVTIADKEAEAFIIDALNKKYPHIPAIGEESFDARSKLSKLCWLIDPLDGTYSFINKNKEFTVNIALMENSKPTAGVIYAPAFNKMYIGSIKAGAFRIEGDDLIKLPDNNVDKITAALSKNHQKQTEKIICGIPEINTLLCGSSLKFGFLAEGSASIYFREGKTMYWDVAAGHALLLASGGNLYDWKTGDELSYSCDTMENSSFIAHSAGRKSDINTLRAMLNKII